MFFFSTLGLGSALEMGKLVTKQEIWEFFLFYSDIHLDKRDVCLRY